VLPATLDENGSVAHGDTPSLDLDQELVAHRAEESFDLAPALWPAGPGVDQADAQHRTRPQEWSRDKSTAVIDVGRTRDAPGTEGVAKRRLQAHGVFGVTPPIADDGSAAIVDEGEQVGLVATDANKGPLRAARW